MNIGSVLHKARLAMLGALVLLGGMLAFVAPASADLRICNETGNAISIALGYRAERGWQSEGWWVAPASQCATVYRGDLNSRFFYLYAADDIGGGAWDGSVFMCTRDDSFTIFGVEDCLARGYERTGFFEVDTQNRTDWTLQLTDPVDNAPQGGDVDLPDDAQDVPANAAPGDAGAEPLGDETAPADDVPADGEPLTE